MIFCASALRSVSGRSKLKSKEGECMCDGNEPLDLEGVRCIVAGFIVLDGVEPA